MNEQPVLTSSDRLGSVGDSTSKTPAFVSVPPLSPRFMRSSSKFKWALCKKTRNADGSDRHKCTTIHSGKIIDALSLMENAKSNSNMNEKQTHPLITHTEEPDSTSQTFADETIPPDDPPPIRNLSSTFKIKLPLGISIAIYILPVVLTALFYLLRINPSIMSWVTLRISAPIRGFMANLTSVIPLSITEVLFTAVGIWLIYYIIKTIKAVIRGQNKLKTLSKQLLFIAVLALYFWSAFSWLWSSGYHAPGFSERNGFYRSGVNADDLIATTSFFAKMANELAPQVARDSEGNFTEPINELFTASTGIYENIAMVYPCLNGTLYRPKPMGYSWVMSRMGYTGMYFALTGEANINTMTPRASLPVTLAHEHAHQLGVHAEDEASFVAILACIKSDNTAFAYSGYLSGLNYLLRAMSQAISRANHEKLYDVGAEIMLAQTIILDSLAPEVRRDRWNSYEFWLSQRTVNTGIGFLDNALTTVNEVVSDAVDAAYDSFLKSQNQSLGLQSYGACVDLLVEYYTRFHPHF